MTIGQAGTPLQIPGDGRGQPSELTIPKVLRLLGAGASGTILIVLGDGPLRTKQLTDRIPGYAPRTIYRYAGKLTQLGIVERDEEPGVPSKVTLQLTEPCGRELHDLVEAYADASLARLPDGEIGAHAWSSFVLLADLWESGMIEELNRGPRSATELARGQHGLSFHQVSRRAGQFAEGGFIEEVGEGGRHRRYRLTAKARKGMALIAGLGRWRRRYVVSAGESGLTASEVAGLLRTVLPLVVLPGHGGKSLELRISPTGGSAARGETVWAEIDPEGAVLNFPEPRTPPVAAAEGGATSWVDSVLDGPRNGLAVEGDARLVKESLRTLHETLWADRKG